MIAVFKDSIQNYTRCKKGKHLLIVYLRSQKYVYRSSSVFYHQAYFSAFLYRLTSETFYFLTKPAGTFFQVYKIKGQCWRTWGIWLFSLIFCFTLFIDRLYGCFTHLYRQQFLCVCVFVFQCLLWAGQSGHIAHFWGA